MNVRLAQPEGPNIISLCSPIEVLHEYGIKTHFLNVVVSFSVYIVLVVGPKVRGFKPGNMMGFFKGDKNLLSLEGQ
jgi:hypothetical protein